MYLTYEKYTGMGGMLEEAAFTALEKKAEYFVNSFANGKTGERLLKAAGISGIPQAVEDCVFELIKHFGDNSFNASNVQSESQTLGGMSESVTYSRLSKDEADFEARNIVETYFYGAGLGKFLYRGAADVD